MPNKKRIKEIEKSMSAEFRAVRKSKRDSKQTVKSHQKDLAKVAGKTAAKNKATAMKKAKQRGVLDATGAAKTKAERRTLRSFK
jgi:CRISPR/Cas system CSM-associated protein Csm4 (group 5 of RAMP superfamily)